MTAPNRIVASGGFVERTRLVRREPEANRARVVMVLALLLSSCLATWIGVAFGLGLMLLAHTCISIGVLFGLGMRIRKLAKLGTEHPETEWVPRDQAGPPINPNNLH